MVIQTLLYYVGLILYNLYLHPLRHYPGPRFAAATSLYSAYRIARGTLIFDVLKLHNEYGEVVRIAPDQLLYIDPSVWKDIYRHNHGRPELRKDPRTHDGQPAGSLINAGTAHHAFLRKQLSPGFSDKALREQEPVIQRFVDLLIRKLGDASHGGQQAVDIAAWFNVSPSDALPCLLTT
jgi:cytochrome P450